MTNIVRSCNIDCPDCDTVFDEYFDLGVEDEDGLTDLAPGDVTTVSTCPHCGLVFQSEYSGWLNYGDAG